MQQELITLKREIRDLKTAQTSPSIMKFYAMPFAVPLSVSRGFHYWTIQFEASENQTEPITYDSNFFFVFENYDPMTNTQKIVFDCPYDDYFAGETFQAYSTRPMLSITFS